MSVKTRSTDTSLETTSREADAAYRQELGDTMSAMRDGAEKATAGMENAEAGFQASQVKMKEGMAKAMKSSEELMTFGQGNLEAAMKSAQIFANGLQDLSQQIASATQSSFEDSIATMKAISGVKSFREAVDLQTDFTRTMMERAVAETGRLTDASLKLTEQAVAPISARVSLAVEKFSNAA